MSNVTKPDASNPFCNAFHIKVHGYLTDTTSSLATQILNTYPDTKILFTSFDKLNNTRNYVLTEDKSDPVKYVGASYGLPSDPKLIEGFVICREYYVANIKRKHIIAIDKGQDAMESIKAHPAFAFTFLPCIDFDLYWTADEPRSIVLELKYRVGSLPLVRLEKKINELPQLTSPKT